MRNEGRPLKILHVAPFFRPRIGGVEKHVEEVCLELSSRHSVSILTCSHEKGLLANEKVRGLAVWRLPYVGKERGYFGRLFQFWKFLSSKENSKKLSEFDIIHLHDVPCFLWLLPFGGKKVVTFHGYERDPVDPLHWALHKFAELLTRDNFCVGNYLRKHYGTMCRDENVFVGAVDSGKVRRRSLSLGSKPRKRILFLTRLAWDTQIREYVEAMRYLPRFRLDVYGEGPIREELESVAKRRRLPVRFFGKWKGDSNELMRKYRFVFASRYLTLLEALANGAVVFSVYNTPVMKDVLVSVGAPPESLVICRTPLEIAKRLKRLARNSSELRRASESSGKFALGLGWNRIADTYERTYLRVLKKS